jgi:hypothetical protein
LKEERCFERRELDSTCRKLVEGQPVAGSCKLQLDRQDRAVIAAGIYPDDLDYSCTPCDMDLMTVSSIPPGHPGVWIQTLT